MWHRRAKQSGRVIGGLLAALFLTVGALLLFLNRQTVLDHFYVWQYQPSSEVQALASRAGMSDEGEFYFFASRPVLQPAPEFNSSCEDHDPEGATLGCYSGGQIYIYDITDPRLDGIREVTAAHEMLHAVYDRLSSKEKEDVNRLIDVAYKQLENDRLANRLKMYDRAQPGTRYVELHAIIGTEYATIPAELEQHYAKYLNNRTQLVALHESYASQFTELEDRAASLTVDINVLGDEIESESASYNTAVRALSRDIESFNARASRGPNSQAEASSLIAERNSLLSRTRQLESRRQSIDNMIARYNQMVQELNSISTEVQDLNKSIDSSLAPAPSV